MTDYKLTHLKQLEAESIHIIREVAAEFERPVMLYSIGKDSAVMLHLAMKAFYPGKPPFPLMHVDTTWKFSEMIQFREKIIKQYDLDLIVYINQDGVKQGIGPFTHGSKTHTDIMKTDALKQALNKYQLMLHLAAPAGMKRSPEPKRGFILFVIKIIAGILKINAQNYEIPTMAKLIKVKASGFSHFQTGQN